MMFWGKWLLPGEKSEEEHVFHQKRHYEAEFAVEEKGHLVGKTFQDTGFMSTGGFELLAMSLDIGTELCPRSH